MWTNRVGDDREVPADGPARVEEAEVVVAGIEFTVREQKAEVHQRFVLSYQWNNRVHVETTEGDRLWTVVQRIHPVGEDPEDVREQLRTAADDEQPEQDDHPGFGRQDHRQTVLQVPLSIQPLQHPPTLHPHLQGQRQPHRVPSPFAGPTPTQKLDLLSQVQWCPETRLPSQSPTPPLSP